jgi:hypothetical protein
VGTLPQSLEIKQQLFAKNFLQSQKKSGKKLEKPYQMFPEHYRKAYLLEVALL